MSDRLKASMDAAVLDRCRTEETAKHFAAADHDVLKITKSKDRTTVYAWVLYEEFDFDAPLELFDPIHTWKRKTFENYTPRELLVPIFKNGELVYNRPDTESIREHCMREIDSLWDEVKRFDNPHEYYVDLSQKLWDVKNDMLHKAKE